MIQIFNRSAFIFRRFCSSKIHIEDENIIIKSIKGSGKGGSKRNTAKNNAQITDKLTGVSVKVSSDREYVNKF